MADGERKTILIVDDTPENLAVLDGILSSTYKVKAAPNGKVALKIAGLVPPPDLVLLDIMMPGMDGYEVLAALRAEEATKGIPVVFITAKGEAGDRDKAMAAGAKDFLTKPVDPDKVLAVAARLVGGGA